MNYTDETNSPSDFSDISDERTLPVNIEPDTDEDVTAQIPTKLPPDDQVPGTPPSNTDEEGKKKKPKKGWIIFLGFVLVIILTAIGGFIGYQAAYNSRKAAAEEQNTIEATKQFELGVADIEAGRYEIAKQRFEYVLQIDSSFPGAMDKLTQVMMLIAQEKTPTPPLPTATIAPTPTKDMRPSEELFNAVQSYLRAGDWVNAIITIEALRTADLTFRPVDVDGMYYIALRGRGINKILVDGNLEGGIYDLTLVERFGPLDKEAEGYRSWARAYIQGASFWKVDWEKVVTYFSQIYPAAPNMVDADGWTAAERYRYALIQYGDQFLAAEDYCSARDQYRIALSIADDPKLGPTATYVQLQCEPPTATLAPFTPTSSYITETPTLESTVAPTEPPVETTAAP
jgi:tetratricopeptide (TPR) repeat protein